MGRTPGGGPSVFRLYAVNAFALGTGLTDGVFMIFIMQTIAKVGGSNLKAFGALAFGGLIAMIIAPMASVGSTSANKRAKITFAMLSFSAFCIAGIAIIYSPYAVGWVTNIEDWRLFSGMALAALYMAFKQASPAVPCVMDAAKTRGDEANYPLRRDISLSMFYLNNRVGLIASSVAVATLPTNYLENLFPIMVVAACLSVVLTILSMVSFPFEVEVKVLPDASHMDPDAIVIAETLKEAEIPKPLLPFRSRVREHMNAALFQADKRLLACYSELIYYGIAFGQLGYTVPCFFNEVVFKNATGNPQGFRWAAYTGLVGQGISLIFDAILPRLVFRPNAKKFTMTTVWSSGAFFGSALFILMMFIKNPWGSLVVFASMDITKGTHSLFSLLCCGSFVEPKYRGTSFSVRAGALNLGILIGTFFAGFLADTGGWTWVMFHSATACATSAFFAAFAGSVEREDYAGVAANMNTLFKYLFQKRRVSQMPGSA